MKAHHVCQFLVSLAAVAAVQAQDSTIPRESADLIKKLNEFTAAEQKAVDDAVALRSEIARLTPQEEDLRPVASLEESENRDLVTWLDGKVFFGRWSYGLLKIDFRDDAAFVDGKQFEIERTRGREILLTPGDPSVGEIDLEVTTDRTRATSPSRSELEGEFFVRVGS
ncbi:MAG: hypothetical protein AAF585_14785 [Verrucomicrobiota bacterium]